jgi:hemin uptake protein HemP
MFEQHLASHDPGTGAAAHPAPPAERPRHAAPRRIPSGQLLSGGNELVIEHAGQEYRLRLTRNDKLILTK